VTRGSDPAPLLSVDEALAQVLATIPGPTESEWAWLGEALGRVVAEPAFATTDLPPWDNSAMDGYAIRSGDTSGATDAMPRLLRVVGDLAAGAAPGAEVPRGGAIRIATGARIPAGADAVIPVESTAPADHDGKPVGPRGRDAAGPLPAAILAHLEVAPGGSIRRRASDLQRGTLVLDAGMPVSPAAIAIAAGAGLEGLGVHRRPVVGVLATGDEVRPAGEPLGEAGVPDANGPALRALVVDAGGDPRSLGIAADRLADVRARLTAGLAEDPDAIVVSGGVSVGPYDHVRTAFAKFGTVDLWRVAVQPGKPFAFGTAPRPGGGRPVLLFGLPGNPVSTFITFELFVRPALRKLGGYRHLTRPVERAVLLDETPKSAGRRAFVRVVAERDDRGTPRRDGDGRVVVRLAGGVAGQGSHVLSALAVAEGLAVIPESVDVHLVGGEVDVWWLDRT
jgi:molybdenum cofactor synthesis domain-containing protein